MITSKVKENMKDIRWNQLKILSYTLLHATKVYMLGSDLGLLISKVFVNFHEGEIRAKIGHFRGFFFFMTAHNICHKTVVLPREKLYSITFVIRTNMTGWP